MLKTLVFSLLNTVLNYDCDGYMVPYANNYQRNRYVDRFFRCSLEILLIMLQYRPIQEAETAQEMIQSELGMCQLY